MNEFPSFKVISYRTTSAGNRGFSGRSTQLGSQAVLEITDIQNLLKELSKVNDETRKQFRKDFRRIAKPVQDEIKQGIRNNRLGTAGNMSGFKKKVIPGRLTWGTGKPATSAIISMPRITTRKAGMAISKITVGSPATVIADMAGKSNRKTASAARTAVYPYSGSPKGERSHKITRLGSRKFIQNLDQQVGGKASRIVYPSAEKALPEARNEMSMTLDSMIREVNRGLRKAN
jgi:hypothetical protein